MIVKHVISVSGGKDSAATLLLAIFRFGRENVIAIFCDTGNEHEDVYDYLVYLEGALGIVIVRLRANFAEQMAVKRMFIARDQRTRREYKRVPYLRDGKPVAKLHSDGSVQRDAKGEVIWRTCKGSSRRVRWTNSGKRRALAVLHPTGNPYLDLCLWKGRFPSRKAQFCTEELKTTLAVEFQMELTDAGYVVVSWQGIRRNESMNRRNAKRFEQLGHRHFIYRPIVDWTAQDVFAYCAKEGIRPNPLYLKGMGRVGCMPCINVAKSELREIAVRFPEHTQRIGEWEVLVGNASKRGFSTFMADAHAAKDRRVIFGDLNIWARIEWAKTTRGGTQYDLLGAPDDEGGCSSSYGLCDQGDAT